MNITALIGTKKYQKQGFLQDGKRVPLTAVNVLGNVITQIKTQDKEGYNALQLGINTNKKARKSIRKHAEKALSSNSSLVKQANSSVPSSVPRFFKEIKTEDLEGATLGSQINASEIFAPGDMVDVTGISKGKGWAGGVKRWGFHGGPRTHGQSDRERAPGSIGQTTTPGRVYRGKKMAGRMGSDTVTVKNLEVIEVTADGVLLIKGLVPGNVNGLVMVKKIGENKKFVPLYKEVSEEVQSSDELLKSPQGESQTGASSQSHVAGDAQGSSDETQSSDSTSLSESRQPEAESKDKQKPESVLSSPANEPATAAFEVKDENETKEEVHPSPKSTEDK